MRTLAIVLLVSVRTQRAAAGPNGGNVVPIKNGSAYAELIANADTGEVMVHTWDKDLKTTRPVEKESITVGSGDSSSELLPHPTASDPPGTCIRFYGHADRARGRTVGHGWMAVRGDGSQRQSFDWRGRWQGGKAHARMWEEIGEHRQMGPGGPTGRGHRGGGKIGDDSAHPFPGRVRVPAGRVRVPAKAVANLTRGEWACS